MAFVRLTTATVGLVLCTHAWAVAQQDAFTIVRADEKEIVVDIVPQDYLPVPVLIGEQQYYRIHAPGVGLTAEEGKPELPVHGVLLGLPPHVTPRVQIIESRFESTVGELIAPVPVVEIENEDETSTHFKKDEVFYSTFNRFYPEDVVHLSEVTQWRHQRVVRLSVTPMQYNPVSQTLKKATHLRLRIELDADAPQMRREWIPVEEHDPHFEPVYRSLLLNYDAAKQWRGLERAAPPPSGFPDTTGGWFAPGRQYIRIPVAHDGMYRITAADFLQAGITPGMVDFPTLALYNNGQSVPVFIGNQSQPESVFVDFYGRRNYGQNSHLDLYTDTSAYFLTWNDTSARRFQIDTMVQQPPTLSPAWYREMNHFEVDLNYYFGYTADEIRTTDPVPGEGWYWRDFFPNTIRTFTFTIDTVARGFNAGASLRSRLHGMSGFFSVPDHMAEFKLNGTVIGQVGFNGNTEAMFQQTFHDSLLRVGSNTLEVRSIPTASPVSKFYLDWFQIEFPRPFLATNNQITFTAAPNPSGPVEFTVFNMSADSVEVFDLTRRRKIVGSLVPVDGLPTTYRFRDTLSIAKKYVVIGQNVRRQVLPLVPKVFRNLRNPSLRADYVIITHGLFRSAADQLALHRQTVSRLRTMVVDVQDIFDEFNFGLKNPVAIRDFLRHAFFKWRRPSPTYIVLFGDASWDYKRNLANSIKTDYVPSYGNPPSDNALVSLDSAKNYLPYMLVGRIPVEDTIQAVRTVNKIIGYDAPPIDEWDKSFLFITGGTNTSERTLFNFYSNRYINNIISPSPIGGMSYRIFKTSDAIVDGEFTDTIQTMINKGLVYINFLGHSGGRIWNVDAGNPNALQNTHGRLPFINSTSCNVGFFSDPRSNVLSEDFFLADNRGAIGVWASSTAGTASTGDILTTKFLNLARNDYARRFGQLTTIARIHYWAINTITTPTVISVVHSHPLVGDPYSMMAIPLMPDLAFKDNAVTIHTDRPTSDSVVTTTIRWWNYGLVPTDSVLVTVSDSYTDEFGVYRGTFSVIPPMLRAPTHAMDSVTFEWDVRGQPGAHVLTARLDSANRIPELTKANNVAEETFYIYRDLIAALTPPSFTTQAAAALTLTAARPAGNDTTPVHYYFEIDTIVDFSSGAKISSPPVTPGPVSAQWTTPALPDGRPYFWRSRTYDGSTYGGWALAALRTASGALPPSGLRWHQGHPGHFQLGTLNKTSATDSGVTMLHTNGLPLFVRSVGARGNPDQDFYSIIRIGNQTIFGLWWVVGTSFMVARINEYSGAFEYRAFNVAATAAQADSMAHYINTTPVGRYVAITVISNGRTNVNENLWQAIESLGSVHIRQVQPGHAWALISRKGTTGPMMTPIEGWSPAHIAICEFLMPTYFSAGPGSVLSPHIGPAHAWHQLEWANDVSAPGTNISVKVLGIRGDETIDTLHTLTSSQTTLNLSSVNAAVHARLRLLATLSNTQAEFTPRLLHWRVDYDPPPELATSAWAFQASPSTVTQGGPIDVVMDVHNVGYRTADSVRVKFLLAATGAELHQVFIDSIPVGQWRTVTTQVPTVSVPVGSHVLQSIVVPKTGTNDLYSGNNQVLFPFTVTGAHQAMHTARVLFDGREIVDGDYVSARPRITVEVPAEALRPFQTSTTVIAQVLIDGEEHARGALAYQPDVAVSESAGRMVSDGLRLELAPELADGHHRLSVYAKSSSSSVSMSPFIERARIAEGTDGVTEDDILIGNVEFQVYATPELRNVYNYPNPFSRETYFTFLLTGTVVPDDFRIRVYTVAGRVVREIHVPSSILQIGFNRIVWDGRDQDGDEVANGLYFYQMTMKVGDKSANVIQRLTKLR